MRTKRSLGSAKGEFISLKKSKGMFSKVILFHILINKFTFCHTFSNLKFDSYLDKKDLSISEHSILDTKWFQRRSLGG